MIPSSLRACALPLLLLSLPTLACSQDSLGQEVEDAKAKASEAATAIQNTASAITDAATQAASQAEEAFFDQVKALRAVKEEVARFYPSTTDYDIVISAEGSDEAAMQEHQAKLKEMEHIQVGALTVGYEEQSERSLGGTAFSRHFRATWISHGQKIGLSYYSKQEFDAKAFAELLMRVVPVVETYLE